MLAKEGPVPGLENSIIAYRLAEKPWKLSQKISNFPGLTPRSVYLVEHHVRGTTLAAEYLWEKIEAGSGIGDFIHQEWWYPQGSFSREAAAESRVRSQRLSIWP